jgi:hypothetical protein
MRTIRKSSIRKNITKKGGMGIIKKIKHHQLRKEKEYVGKDDKTIDFIEHHNKECKRFIFLLKSIILIIQRSRKSSGNMIIVMSGKEMHKKIKSSKEFNNIYNSMNPEQKESYKEYMELFLNMGHSILVNDYNFEMLKKVNAFAIIRNKQIYTDFINYKKEVENLSIKDKQILNELPPDEFYYIPIQSWIKETKKTGIHGNEALTMKQKFEVLNIKFDPYNEAINSNAQTNPLINSSVNPYKSENSSEKGSENNSKKGSKNTPRKASYNETSKSYLCDPTNFELILPPTHTPSESVIGKKRMMYYKIPIPLNTKPGSRIRFKQPTPPIPNINHNAGKNPPNCPPTQRLRSVNHIPTNEKSNSNRKYNYRDSDRNTAEYKISSSIPRLDLSSSGIETMATRANYARNGTTPFTSGPQGPARETFTPERFKEQLWRNGLAGKNPLNRFKEFPKIVFPQIPTW